MFYVKFPSEVVTWGNVKRTWYEDFMWQNGLREGKIYLVEDGTISGRNAKINYLRFAKFFQMLPTFRGHLSTSTCKANTIITIDLFLENGLLVESCKKVKLLSDPRPLTKSEGGDYLLLCELEGERIQVIATNANLPSK